MVATRTVLAGSICLLALSLGCDLTGLPGRPDPKSRPVSPDQLVSFQPLYRQNCAGCHGMGGELGPAPPLNDPLFLAIASDTELAKVVTHGRAGTLMPGFSHEVGGPLTDEQVQVLVRGIRTEWGRAAGPSGPLPTYEVGEVTSPLSADHRKQAESLFARVCANCHGDQGRGLELDGRIDNAINVPAFLALMSDQALRRIIITGRSDLGMPNFAESKGRGRAFQRLSKEEIQELVSLLADWRRAGSSSPDERESRP